MLKALPSVFVNSTAYPVESPQEMPQPSRSAQSAPQPLQAHRSNLPTLRMLRTLLTTPPVIIPPREHRYWDFEVSAHIMLHSRTCRLCHPRATLWFPSPGFPLLSCLSTEQPTLRYHDKEKHATSVSNVQCAFVSEP